MKIIFTIASGLLLLGLGAWVGIQFTQPANDLSHRTRPEPSAVAPPDTSPQTRTAKDQLAPPQATLATVASHTSAFARTVALYGLLSTASAADIVTLLDDAPLHFSGRDYATVTHVMYGRLAELDEALALRLVKAQSGPLGERWLRSVFHALARLNLANAIERAKELPTASMQQKAARAILRSRDDLPRQEQLDIAAELNVQIPIDPYADDHGQRWEEALAIDDFQMRSRRLMEIAQRWGDTDPRSALNASDSLPQGLKFGLQFQILSKWAEHEPEAAWEWLHSADSNPNLRGLEDGLMRVIAMHDLDRARAIIDDLPEQRGTKLIGAIAAPWAQRDPDAFIDWFASVEDGNTRRNIVNQFATGSMMQGIEDAVFDRLRELLNPEERSMMDAITFSVMAQTDPQRAAERIEAIEDAEQRAQQSSNLVSNWARNDRAAARRWIERQPSDTRGPLYQSLTTQWAQQDAQVATAFARGIDDPKDRDQALTGVLLSLSRGGDVDLALQLYDEINDADLRQTTARQIYARMRHQDPDRADTFALRSGIGLRQDGQVILKGTQR